MTGLHRRGDGVKLCFRLPVPHWILAAARRQREGGRRFIIPYQMIGLRVGGAPSELHCSDVSQFSSPRALHATVAARRPPADSDTRTLCALHSVGGVRCR